MKATVKISSGKSSGAPIAKGKVRIASTGGKPRVTGKPIYTTSAQMNIRISRGSRPTKTEFKRAN